MAVGQVLTCPRPMGRTHVASTPRPAASVSRSTIFGFLLRQVRLLVRVVRQVEQLRLRLVLHRHDQLPVAGADPAVRQVHRRVFELRPPCARRSRRRPRRASAAPCPPPRRAGSARHLRRHLRRRTRVRIVGARSTVETRSSYSPGLRVPRPAQDHRRPHARRRRARSCSASRTGRPSSPGPSPGSSRCRRRRRRACSCAARFLSR